MILYVFVVILIILIICIACCNKDEGDGDGDGDNKGGAYGIGIIVFFIIIIIVMFAITWPEMEVDKNYKGRCRNRMCWVNTNNLDVTSNSDRSWANNLMMNQAPNKLGIIVVVKAAPKTTTQATTQATTTTQAQAVPTTTEQFVHSEKMQFLSAYEKFTILFGHPPKYVKFKNKPSKETKEFVKEKFVKIKHNNLFRRKLKS